MRFFRTLCAAVGALACVPAWAGLPTYPEVRAAYASSEGVLLDRNGKILQETRSDPKLRRLQWLDLTEVSPVLLEAVIASEDRRYWSHGGVDWFALAGAAARAVTLTGSGKRAGGASTIPMQLVEFLRQGLVARYTRKSVATKIRQVREALTLHPRDGWTKEHILEAYLNLISFRGELQGLSAASQALFGKSPHGLGLSEALILAALVRSPSSLEADVERRACDLGYHLRGGDFDCSGVRAWLMQGILTGRQIPSQITLAPHLAQIAKSQNGRTTLDADLQRWVGEVLERQVLSVRSQNVRDAAAVVIDNRSGEILAYVGGLGTQGSARYVDGVRTPRQAGSTLKPFLYALAIERRYLTAASPVEDIPTDIAVGNGLYRPRNYDKLFHGRDIPLRIALSSSLNVPAVRALTLVGIEPFVRTLESLGFTGLREAEYYGPSLALGSADVTLWDLALAYRTLANKGKWDDGRMQPGDSGRHSVQVFSPDTAFIISNILSDRESRALTFGLENPLSLPFWSAAKTGTSKDMRDNWCLGYSERYTVGVWVGNFSGAPMWNVSGISGAAPAWAEILKWLHRPGQATSRAPSPTPGVVKVAISPDRPEWFLRGTAPTLAGLADPIPPRARITYPVEGMVVALDPDIPAERQRLFFSTDSSKTVDPGLRWIVNGEGWDEERIAEGFPIRDAGTVEIKITDLRGKILDQVAFTVRGGLYSASHR